MKIWGFFLLLTCLAPLLVKADEARLRIAIEGGAFNAKFKFFDASAGCPGYNDIPGARDYLGGVFASSKGSTKVLPTDTPVHVFLFSPRDTPDQRRGWPARDPQARFTGDPGRRCRTGDHRIQ